MATQRSFFMTAVVLIAVMVDRRAITFRTLAVAAMIVLTVRAGSAGASRVSRCRLRRRCGLRGAGTDRRAARCSPTDRSMRASRAWRCGAAPRDRDAVAGLIGWRGSRPRLMRPFTFTGLTPYSVLANLAAMPVVSGGGDAGGPARPRSRCRSASIGLFWTIMGIGIDWMIAVTQWVAALLGAVGRVPAFGIGPLIAASLGIILLGLLRTPLRWSGAARAGAGGGAAGRRGCRSRIF